MPFRSKAQIEKFRSMVVSGEMTQETFAKWMRETPDAHLLPERKVDESKKKTMPSKAKKPVAKKAKKVLKKPY